MSVPQGCWFLVDPGQTESWRGHCTGLSVTQLHTVWYNIIQLVTVWYSIIQFDTVWHSVIPHYTVWHSVIQHYTVGHSVIQHYTVRHIVIQHYTVWHSVIQHYTVWLQRSILSVRVLGEGDKSLTWIDIDVEGSVPITNMYVYKLLLLPFILWNTL